jgi:uncharacterized protein YecE (DUF72 family)
VAAQICLTGCCGWSEAQRRYVADFPVIEIQQTFYEPPSPAVAEKWRALAPPQFHFCLKAWQLITHTPSSPTYRRLKSPIAPSEQNLFGSFRPTEQVWLAWERTRAIAVLLRASVVVFQCPASFLPVRENVQNLRAFLQRVGTQPFHLAWEPRGSWPASLVRDLCAEHNLIHCVDPFESEPLYGDSLYWRLHGRGSYRYRYTAGDLDELERRLLRCSAHTAGPSYVLFNNMAMKEDALRFQAQLNSRSSGG